LFGKNRKLSSISLIRTRNFLAGLSIFLVCVGCGEHQPLESFDVQFVVLTNHPDAEMETSEPSLRKEIEILNRYFRAEDGSPAAFFQFKNITYRDDVHDTKCQDLLALGDGVSEYDGARWNRLINECEDIRLRDPKAINIYINDAWSEKWGRSEKNSHGRINDYRPYLIIDWERLGHRIQSPEEHEMGHAFGLQHVCVEGATPQTPTNIMASASCGKGSGGLRNLGFDSRQIEVIRANSKKIQRRFQKSGS